MPKTSRGGVAHKMGGGQMIYPKNGGSVDAIDHFWGECSSKVIFLGGVEIKLVDFGGSVVPVVIGWFINMIYYKCHVSQEISWKRNKSKTYVIFSFVYKCILSRGFGK